MDEEQEIKELIQELSKKGVWARKSTKERLVEIGEPALPHLIEKIKYENGWVVYGVIIDIGEPAVPYLMDALKTTNDIRLKDKYGNLIGRIGASAIPYLEDALKDEENRDHIVEILGDIDDASVIPLLVKALDDKGDSVRYHSARSLRDISQKGHDVSEAVPKLIKMLKGMGSLSAIGAVEALGKIKDPRAFPHMIEKLRSENNSNIVGEALKEIGKPVVPHLIEALKHENDATKQRIIVVLGKIRDDSAVPALIDILVKDKNGELLKAAMEALGKIGDASSVPVLMNIFRDSEWFQDEAFEALRINAINLFHKKEYVESLRIIKKLAHITRNKYPLKNATDNKKKRILIDSFSDLTQRTKGRINRLDRDEPLKMKRKSVKPEKGKRKDKKNKNRIKH